MDEEVIPMAIVNRGLEILKDQGNSYYKCWSIHICEGPSLTYLNSIYKKPIIDGPTIDLEKYLFAADPFYIFFRGEHRIYFELFSKIDNYGVIGMATSSNIKDWYFDKVVLKEDFHVSYPCVFTFADDLYMLPECREANFLRLYKANKNGELKLTREFLPGEWADPTLFFKNSKWWLFVCSSPFKNNSLELYYSNSLDGKWIRHPKSPIVDGDKRYARPAGKVFSHQNRLYRVAQDCSVSYGKKINFIEILDLTPNSYEEKVIDWSIENTKHAPLDKWASLGMHHIDIIKKDSESWLCLIDGANSRILHE